jgi:hypothetical protein
MIQLLVFAFQDSGLLDVAEEECQPLTEQSAVGQFAVQLGVGLGRLELLLEEVDLSVSAFDLHSELVVVDEESFDIAFN